MIELERTTWTCPTCGVEQYARYCGSCGERRLGHHDLTLLGLAEQVVEAVGHVDGRIFRTFRALIVTPGSLTAAYLAGVRKAYIGPFQLFLIVNVLFFGAQSITGGQVFSTPFARQLQGQYYSRVARSIVEARLAAAGTGRERYAEVFDHAVVVNAKSLVILMVPPFALGAALLFARRGRPVVAHVVFAMHFLAFVLFQFAVLSLLAATVRAVMSLFGGPALVSTDALVPLQLLLFAWYLHAAIGRTYGRTGIARLASAVALTLVSMPVIIAYRFAVFLVTIYTT